MWFTSLGSPGDDGGCVVSGSGNGQVNTLGSAPEDRLAIPTPGEAQRMPVGGDRSSFPQFYRDPSVLDPAAHGGLRLKPTVQCEFAARTNSIALGANEFYPAQAHYPIVFTMGTPVSAVAVVGLE